MRMKVAKEEPDPSPVAVSTRKEQRQIEERMAVPPVGSENFPNLVWLPKTPSTLKTEEFRSFVRSWRLLR
jgi:hypothetical protein